MSEPPADGFSLRHEIFVLDANLSEKLSPQQHEQQTVRLVQRLLTSLDMEKLGDLQIYFAVDMRAPGWSFIQPITTSHISGHYFEKPGKYPNIHIDIYSCRSVNWKEVIRVLCEDLPISDWRANFIVRNIEEQDDRKVIDIVGKGGTVQKETIL